jgi:type III secretory pathway component EscV
MTLDDLLRRFAVLPVGDGPTRTVRGILLAIAQDWLITLPPGPEKDQAIDYLALAAERACGALTGG